MKKLKVKILNEFGHALNLKQATAIVFLFPYMGDRVLEKRNANIIDADEAIVEVELSDFDVQGLNVADEQNFKAQVSIGGIEHTVLFAKGLNVKSENGRKQIK